MRSTRNDDDHLALSILYGLLTPPERTQALTDALRATAAAPCAVAVHSTAVGPPHIGLVFLPSPTPASSEQGLTLQAHIQTGSIAASTPRHRSQPSQPPPAPPAITPFRTLPPAHTPPIERPHAAEQHSKVDSALSRARPQGTARDTAAAAPSPSAHPADSDDALAMHARRTAAGAGSDGERARAAEARRAEQTKADQLVQHFYAKTCAVVSQARATHLADFDPPGTPLSPSAAAAAGPASGGLAGVGGSSRSRRGSFSGRDKPRRTNKWFNLELPDNEQFRPELRTWRNVSRLLSTPSSTSSSFSSSSSSRPSPHLSPVPCMTLDVLLSTSDLTPNQALVLSNERGKRTRVSSPRTVAGAPGPSPYAGRASPATASGGALRSPLARAADASSAHPSAPAVVLERWTLALVPPERAGAGETELPTVYKRAIGHFRALYQLVRVLPAYALHRKLARRRGSGAGAAGAAGTSGGAAGGGGGGAGRSGGLGIEMRMRVGGAGEGAEGRAEIGLEDRLEEDGADEKETATIVFSGVATPSGTLLLSVTYRNNTDFSVEEIETLLSSRFIDEDFFRPTVARYASTTSAAHDDHARPGSLPISSSPLARGGSPALSGPGRGMTGLGPLPSYGSLSSRHQYAGPQATTQQHGPVAPSPLSLSPQQQHPEQPAATPGPVPVPGASPSPSPRPSSYLARTGESASSSPLAGGSGSSRRYSSSLAGGPSSATAAPSTSATAHAAAGGGGGAAVEPAFISLSRARGNSFVSGGSGSGIQRVSPSPGSASSAIVRRTSITSSSGGGGGGSPIFRPGSYLAHAAHASGSYTGGSPSGGTTGAPASRQLVSGSPLATGGVFGSSGSYTSRGASYAYSRAGVGAPAGSSGGSGEVPWALGGPESGGSSVGAGAGVPALARRASGGAAATGTAASSRLSFGQAGSLGRASAAGPSRLGTMMRQYQEGGLGGGGAGGGGASGSPSTAASSSSSFGGADKKRFIHEGRAPDDADDINSFLSLLDSKPDLKALDASRLASSSSYAASGSAQQQQRGGAGGAGPGPRGSMVLNKRDVDEQLRLLRSSVFGGFPSSAGGGGESPSPPPLSLLTAGGGVSSSPRGGGGPAAAGGGLSSLRRQTSRLSIEEDPAAEAAANARERASAARAGDGGAQSSSLAAAAAAGAGGYRSSLHAIASPPLSTAASPSAAAFAPALSSSTGDAPPHQHRAYHRASGPEPRFLPLPVSSTTSPLASPGSRASHDPPPPPPPQLAAPYPPLPYPPAATPTTSTSTEPVTIRGPSTYTYLSRAARQPVNPPTAGRGGFAGGGGGARGESVAASVASFETGGTGGTGTEASSLYRYDDDEGEGEAAGRLELDEDEGEGAGEGEGRQGRWGARRDEDDDALAPSAAVTGAAARLHSRDTTPAATRLGGGGAGLASGAAPGGGYFAAARRAASASRASGGAGAGGSPPEISWMG